MNDGVGGVRKKGIVFLRQAEALGSQVPAKNMHAGIQVIEEFRKIKMKLQGPPQTFARFLFGAGTHQQIYWIAMLTQQPGNQVAAEIAGRAGYEDRHKGSEGGAETALARAACADQSSSRGARDSSGRPSMSG